jgi:hypothetical protein
MVKYFQLLHVVFAFTFSSSCFQDIKVIQPVYNKPVEEISTDITTLISFSQLTITSKNEVTSATNPTAKLVIELKDASITVYSEGQLKEKSKDIAKRIRKSVTNVSKFDLITIIYSGKDISVDGNIKVYAFFPRRVINKSIS